MAAAIASSQLWIMGLDECIHLVNHRRWRRTGRPSPTPGAAAQLGGDAPIRQRAAHTFLDACDFAAIAPHGATRSLSIAFSSCTEMDLPFLQALIGLLTCTQWSGRIFRLMLLWASSNPRVRFML